MKRSVLVIACVCMFIAGGAQKITGCGFKVPPRSVLKSDFASVYEAKTILETMLQTIQWQENFSIREQNGIRNAYATIINRVRWIIYDNNFLEDIDSYTSTKWASVSVLAHEMGHHYYNHVVTSSGSTPPKEIEADAFSGFVMQKLGATLNESIAAMSAIATTNASSTHPAKKDRLVAITRGWNVAQTNTTAPPVMPTNPYPTNPSNPTNPAPTNPTTTSSEDATWISLSFQSIKDEKVMLSDDGQKYVEAEIKAGQSFVFKFEIYNYGWLRLPYYNGYRVYKLLHGKDYSILWNRRTKNFTLVEVPE